MCLASESAETSAETFGTGYDFNSVMNYGRRNVWLRYDVKDRDKIGLH